MRPIEIPAMANAHSHAFQRALRGRAERPSPKGKDDFWSWRDEMYMLAGSLTPESIESLSRHTFEEMKAAGYGAVGEFHYVHHQPDGTPYDDPNAMAKAVARAAQAADLPIVLLPAAYDRAGWKQPPSEGQRRFCDPDVYAFLHRVENLREWAYHEDGVSVGVAAHSPRAVPSSWLEAIAAWSDEHGTVRHVHAAEQPREVEEVRAEYGCSPIELLERTSFLGERASVVHAIHVDARDITLLAETKTTVVSCPTTEGNLGDGYPPLLAFRDAGIPIALGSDSQVRIDPFEEARELETLARREGRTRDALLTHSPDLWRELCENGARALGLAATGNVTVDLDHPQLLGVELDGLPWTLVTAASAAVVL